MGAVKNTFIWGAGGRKSITLLEDTQASPACPSSRSSMKTAMSEEEEKEEEEEEEEEGVKLVTVAARNTGSENLVPR